MIRSKRSIQAALKGVNAAVVGILLAALYNPVFISSIGSAYDFAVAIIAFTLLFFYKWAPWIVVIVTAVLGAILHVFGL